MTVPLLREHDSIGAMSVARDAAQAYSTHEIALVEMFADQAVIAIENARLFENLTEALEQQTATAEVLKVISRSAFDLQPVLDTLVENAVRLCGADRGWIYRFNDESFLRGRLQRHPRPQSVC